ncbi:MAG: outer membrane beta-barrel protein [Bacteroidetes bacterium]|nr:outer membrane beta-barrel protein [Bacteroidota bacterium]
MKKHFYLFALIIASGLISIQANAQYRTRVYVNGGYRSRPPMMKKQFPRQSSFQPSLEIKMGYGLPNLDKNNLAIFGDAYQGSISQQGPFTGSLDYRFSPMMSIGVMGTYGKVSAPYYDYSNGTNVPDFTGRIENWSLMLNMMSYMPTMDRKVEPYLRTAIGINNYTQSYLDAGGNKAAIVSDPSQLAYQISLGANFHLSKQAGIFLEAGYGKYIFSGGLSLKF